MPRRVLRCSVPPATKPGIAAIVSRLGEGGQIEWTVTI